MDVGILLRNARERRRLSIEELSAATKIPVPVLRAMEAGDFTRVPGGIFTRGFLRAVAREIDLDPEDLVARYLAELELLHSPAQPVAAAAAPAAPDGRAAGRRRSAAQIVWLAAAALGWIVMARALATEPSGPVLPAPPLPPAESHLAIIESPGEAPVALASSEPSTIGTADGAAIGTTGGGIRVDLQPRGDCWVEATLDGAPVIYRLMHAGERESLQIGSELVLRVGDPAAFAFAINGVPGRVLGERRTPVTVRLTADDYGELLAR